VDLAKALGSLATVNFLIREFIGPFKVNEALVSSQITKERMENSIISMDKLKDLGL
jgi:hypothetical protein